MSDLVDPFTGKLLDAPTVGRPGDSDPTASNRANPRRWGSRMLLSNNEGVGGGPSLNSNPPRGRRRAIAVDTKDLGRSHSIDIQMRFAASNAQGMPTLPWISNWAFGSPLDILVSRGIDPTATTSPESFQLSQSTEVLPFDILTARNLQIEVAMSPLFPPVEAWVETIATLVSDIAQRDEIQTYSARQTQSFVATNIAAVQFLTPNAARAQFFIVNTSTTSNLLVKFGASAPVWPNNGTFVLPKNQFAVYESPVNTFGGSVWGIWDVAGDGGAIITSGSWR